jgi:hypothetical protein
MRISFLIILLISFFPWLGKSQSAGNEIDTVAFNYSEKLANQLVECELHTQLAIEKYTRIEDISKTDWISYKENNIWHTIGGTTNEKTFNLTKHVVFDTVEQISEFTGLIDTMKLESLESALIRANTDFQLVRDTSNFYFNAFVYPNENKTISVWFLPAFQPSGQALYGCEWEYVFDSKGTHLQNLNSFTNKLTGVWIGQPRELWLNYRNTDTPTLGSIFFALSFRDYFTRIRIDTRKIISTTSKDGNGKYFWIHKLK